MNVRRGGSPFSLNYLFASFFGALLIAGAFAYQNYRFSEYKFIDFTKKIFYTKSDIFSPSQDEYTVVIYSSNMQAFSSIYPKLKKDSTVLAVDLFQKRENEQEEVIHMTAGMNTLLSLVQKFNIYEVPSAFRIKRFRGSQFKQDSMIETVN